MIAKRLLAPVLLALALVPGCATRNNYLLNRGADLADILRLHVMFGPGAGAKVDVFRVIHGGILYTHDSFAFGLHNRAVGPWRETIFSWGLLVGQHNEIETRGIDRLSGSYGWVFGEKGEGGVFLPPNGKLDLDMLTVRGTAMLVVGVDCEVRIGEVLDFLAGIFQFDPAGDDEDYEAMLEPEMPPEPPPAGGDAQG